MLERLLDWQFSLQQPVAAMKLQQQVASQRASNLLLQFQYNVYLYLSYIKI